jgi:hypothetical protein
MTGDQIRGATAQSMMDIRSLRTKLFSKDLFAEFAWDMILSLFVGLANNQVISEADLISKTGVGENAGKRWIDHLIHSGHVARQHGHDVVLTPETITRLRNFLDEAKALRDCGDFWAA